MRAAPIDRQGRGIGGEEAVGADHVLQVLEELLLDFQVLDDGLDHHGAVGQFAEAVGDADALHRLGAGAGVELALGAQLVQGLGQGRAGFLGALRAGVVEPDLQAGQGGDRSPSRP